MQRLYERSVLINVFIIFYLGSLEKPVEILTNKRDRKTTERLSLDKYTPSKSTEEIDYTKVRVYLLTSIARVFTIHLSI